MQTVGIVLLAAWVLVLTIMFSRSRGSLKKSEAAAPRAPQAVPATGGAPSGQDRSGVNNAHMAVIAAAVAAMLDGQGRPGRLMVRSVRRVQGAPAWNRAGREEQIYSRL